MAHKWRFLTITVIFHLYGIVFGFVIATAAPQNSSPSLSQTQAPPTIPDTDIMASLTPKLMDYSKHYPGELGLKVHNGIVTLTGAARNPRAKTRVIADAEATRGVRAVIDRIIVTPVHIPDEELKHNIETALRMDPSTSSYNLHVTVSKNKVTLKGSLDSASEKALALWVMEGVDGVQSVRSDIKVPTKSPPSDAVLEKLTMHRIQTDPVLSGNPIEVRAHKGQIHLFGTVRSLAAQRKAIWQSWKANPSLVDATELRVDPSLPIDSSKENFRISDFDIWNAIDSSFHEDPRLQSSQPQIAVKEGVVTLFGSVDSFIAKHSAVEDAGHVQGVVGVTDKLTLDDISHFSDTTIKSEIKRSLNIQAPDLNNYVALTVQQGHVILQGEVPSAYQKWLAWDSAARSRGVKSIQNEIRVNQTVPAPYIDELHDSIRAALKNDALLSPSDSIHVTVVGRQATLKGSVTSTADRIRACEDASRSGAFPVMDDLDLKLGSTLLRQKEPSQCG